MSAYRLGPEVRRAAVIVAHPDDETLWCGGLMLLNPHVSWEIVALCRGDDPDRAPRFAAACSLYGAACAIGGLDDGPEQRPLERGLAEEMVLALLSRRRYDLLLTHGPHGEYTRHRRHEETHRAVGSLVEAGRLEAGTFMCFAYDDREGQRRPVASEHADLRVNLPRAIHSRKQRVISEIYGFSTDGFEYEAAGRVEAFDRICVGGLN